MQLSPSTEWLFYHLWKKNTETFSSCPGIFVTDTIIYRLNFLKLDGVSPIIGTIQTRII